MSQLLGERMSRQRRLLNPLLRWLQFRRVAVAIPTQRPRESRCVLKPQDVPRMRKTNRSSNLPKVSLTLTHLARSSEWIRPIVGSPSSVFSGLPHID